MKNYYLITATLLISFIAFFIQEGSCQNEANIWYYKNGEGLDFTNGTPVLLSNGSTGQCEGTAAISDKLGNLLFYTDGVTIWNSTHLPMPNGTGLMGDISTNQSAMIIPKPMDSLIYYVFTIDQTCGPLSYSIVDMNLDGGLGDVVSGNKNSPLLSSTFEKMAAVHHCNGNDIWVMVMNADNGDFYAWLVDENGLCDCPVISSTGPLHNHGWGCIKFSNNGEKLVVTDHPGACSGAKVRTDLYYFNNNSGEVTFYQEIDGNDGLSTTNGGNFWGASFSPNNQLLYLSTGYLIYKGSGGTSQGMAVVQYDLNSANIESSAVLLYDDLYIAGSPVGACGSPMGSLQLGPDGRIYVGNSCTNGKGIDVIENPDVPGIGCNYIHGGVPGGDGSGYGITNFIESYFGQGVDPCAQILSNDMCDWIIQKECNPIHIETEAIKDNSSLIYPNPTTGKIKVKANDVIKIHITNFQGTLVFIGKENEIDLTKYPCGIYMIQVITGKQTITKKIVKQ